MLIQDLLAMLQQVKKEGKWWRAQCPAHNDPRGSLTVKIGDTGKILLHCHAGCDKQDIMDALGIGPKDLHNDIPQPPGKRSGPSKRPDAAKIKQAAEKQDKRREDDIVAKYDYCKPDGTLYYQVIRFPDKQFSQRRRDKNDPEKWIWNLQGITPILYNLPALQDIEPDPNDIIAICEGEKDVHTLQALDIHATTSNGGADNAPNVKDISILKNQHIAIFPDNDEPGNRFAEAFAERLHGYAATVRIVRLPHKQTHDDVTDYVERRRSQGADDTDISDEIITLARTSPDYDPDRPPDYSTGYQTMAELFALNPQPPEFIIPEILPVGLTIISGRPKARKSWMTLQWLKAITTGSDFYKKQMKVGRGLYVPLEDSPARVNKRARLLDWPINNPGQCDILYSREFRQNFGTMNERTFADKLKRAIINRQYCFVAIDTFARAFIGDHNDASAITTALAPLQEIAIELGISITIVDHHKKGAGQNGVSKDVVSDISGSVAKAGILDCSISIYRDPRREDEGQMLITGRDVNDQELFIENMNEKSGGWRVVGDNDSHQHSLAQKDIVKALQTRPEEGLSVNELIMLTEHSKSSIYRHLQELRMAHEVIEKKIGRGKKYIYQEPPELPEWAQK